LKILCGNKQINRITNQGTDYRLEIQKHMLIELRRNLGHGNACHVHGLQDTMLQVPLLQTKIIRGVWY
jgi:hypothetical protein